MMRPGVPAEKGFHPARVADTTYKENLLNLLTQHPQTAVPTAELILDCVKPHIHFLFLFLLQKDSLQRVAGVLGTLSA